MISVGVDVDRLGLMVVMGQPQATSEYIQATSRVGRKHPGLVVTLLNAARSRDRSHYEASRATTRALYRQVESTSVTPFSPRARDRALHAVLIALARLTVPGLRENRMPRAASDHRAELEQAAGHDPHRVAERSTAASARATASGPRPDHRALDGPGRAEPELALRIRGTGQEPCSARRGRRRCRPPGLLPDDVVAAGRRRRVRTSSGG